MRYFITGAQGFVGRYLTAHLLTTDPTVEVLGMGRSASNSSGFTHIMSWGRRAVLSPLPRQLRQALTDSRYAYARLDLAETDRLAAALREFQPHYIVHLASALRGDPGPVQFRTNVEGSLHLLSAVEQARIRPERIVFGSSGGVYGFPAEAELPWREDALCRPADLYSVSKLAAEHATRLETLRLGLDAVWVRIFNILGSGQDERHVCGKLASQAAAIRAGILPPRIEVGGLESTRDFIDVRDVARGLDLIARGPVPGGVVNLASGVETRIAELLDIILRDCGLERSIEIRQRGDDRPATRHVADVTLLRALGFRSEFRLEDSLRELVDHYLSEVATCAA
jgi:GDP-4-dehydro-6-deoxy-D-mannose reductase